MPLPSSESIKTIRFMTTQPTFIKVRRSPESEATKTLPCGCREYDGFYGLVHYWECPLHHPDADESTKDRARELWRTAQDPKRSKAQREEAKQEWDAIKLRLAEAEQVAALHPSPTQ